MPRGVTCTWHNTQINIANFINRILLGTKSVMTFANYPTKIPLFSSRMSDTQESHKNIFSSHQT